MSKSFHVIARKNTNTGRVPQKPREKLRQDNRGPERSQGACFECFPSVLTSPGIRRACGEAKGCTTCWDSANHPSSTGPQDKVFLASVLAARDTHSFELSESPDSGNSSSGERLVCLTRRSPEVQGCLGIERTWNSSAWVCRGGTAWDIRFCMRHFEELHGGDGHRDVPGPSPTLWLACTVWGRLKTC